MNQCLHFNSKISHNMTANSRMQSLLLKNLQINFINLRLHPPPPQDPLLCAPILEQSMWARNRVGIGVVVPAHQAT